MGKLIQMPPTKNVAETEERTYSLTPVTALQVHPQSVTDFTPWLVAPRERTPDYFPVYSAVSKAMQGAMRGWVRGWLARNPDVLRRPHQAYAVLVYQTTHPFSGRPTNIFTYDIQQTKELTRAFRSATARLGPQLRKLEIKRLPWYTREHYFAYRRKEVIKYVQKHPRLLYRMLHVETLLVDALLRFSIMDLPELGMEESLVRLRRSFNVQLHRFSELFDLAPLAEDLLSICTAALVKKMDEISDDLLLAA